MTALRKMLNRLGQRLVSANTDAKTADPVERPELVGEMLCSSLHPSVGNNPVGLCFKATPAAGSLYNVRAHAYQPSPRLSVPGNMNSAVVFDWAEMGKPVFVGTYKLDDSLLAIRLLEIEHLQKRNDAGVQVWKYNALASAQPANIGTIAAERGITLPNPPGAPPAAALT